MEALQIHIGNPMANKKKQMEIHLYFLYEMIKILRYLNVQKRIGKLIIDMIGYAHSEKMVKHFLFAKIAIQI